MLSTVCSEHVLTVQYISTKLTQRLIQGCRGRSGLNGSVCSFHGGQNGWRGLSLVSEGGTIHVQVELALSLRRVPSHVPPTLALAHRALGGEVRVADQVHVCQQRGNINTEQTSDSWKSCLQSYRKWSWNMFEMDQRSEASEQNYWANFAGICRI